MMSQKYAIISIDFVSQRCIKYFQWLSTTEQSNRISLKPLNTFKIGNSKIKSRVLDWGTDIKTI